MITKLMTNPLTYIALLIVAASIYGLLNRRTPQNLRNGLYIPMLLGVGLIVYLVIRPPTMEEKPEPLTGEFTVPAYQSRGVPYVNYMSFPIEVDFVAQGKWSTAQYYQTLVGPQGSTQEKEADGRYRLPGSYKAALIARFDGNPEYMYIGARKRIKLKSKQKILFYINDFKTEKAYSDNAGEMKVHWTCHNCKDLVIK